MKPYEIKSQTWVPTMELRWNHGGFRRRLEQLWRCPELGEHAAQWVPVQSFYPDSSDYYGGRWVTPKPDPQ